MSCIVVDDTQLIKKIKNKLDDEGVLDRRNKIIKESGVVRVFATAPPANIQNILQDFASHVQIESFLPQTIDKSISGLTRTFLEASLLSAAQIDLLVDKVPRKWSVYHPMILFGSGTFDSDPWVEVFELGVVDKKRFFASLLSAFPTTVTHFAVNKPIIEQDVMRRPFNLIPLYGDFGPEPNEELFDLPTAEDLQDAFWCHVVQNGIYQTWAPRYTMFSRGNIKEKKRILDSFPDLRGKMVLDLYAGIGYFTLSYLANGATLMCWELNPWSIEGLVKGLAENGYKYKLVSSNEHLSQQKLQQLQQDGVRAFIFHESNESALERIKAWGRLPIAHVNLGLLPSLKSLWPIVREIQNYWTTTTMIAHVHENARCDEFDELCTCLEEYFGNAKVLHLERVKTFAPDVWHTVVDVKMEPQEAAGSSL